MTTQAEVFAEPWAAVIVLDALRADYAQAEFGEFRSVRALGGITSEWCDKFWSSTGDPIVHVTANPVVTYAHIKYRPAHVTVANIWLDWWEEFGNGLGSVAPQNAARAAWEWLDRYGEPSRFAVTFLQPHTPYIGAKMLPMRTGNIVQGPTSSNDCGILEGINKGLFSWEDVRECYRANLRLVLTPALAFARALAERLEGSVIVTSDHGESLGECGEFGHAGAHWTGLLDVPLLVIDP